MSIGFLEKFFCSAEDPRHFLHQPGHFNGRICATNGHWFAVMPAGTPIPADMPAVEGYDPTDFIAACDNPDPGTVWLRAMQVGVTPSRPCGLCDGAGRVSLTDCDVCDGQGYFKMGSHTYECEDCGGTGDVWGAGDDHPCKDCDGEGIDSPGAYTPSTLGPPRRAASGHYIHLLRQLDGWISAAPVPVGRHSALYLIGFRDVRGILMPTSADPLPLSQSDLAQGAAA